MTGRAIEEGDEDASTETNVQEATGNSSHPQEVAS
jgi:hypothetical protein